MKMETNRVGVEEIIIKMIKGEAAVLTLHISRPCGFNNQKTRG